MQLNNVDRLFHETYQELMEGGFLKPSRTGVDILMKPAMVMSFDLSDDKLPWASTRGLRHKQSSEEMEWFISGDSHIKFLRDRKNGIWDDWFIKGTDKYDEPQNLALTTQQRITLGGVLGHGADIVKIIKHRLDVSGVAGFDKISVFIDRAESVVFTGLPFCDLQAIDKELDKLSIPREVLLWPATSGENKLTEAERLALAVEMSVVEDASMISESPFKTNDILDWFGVPARRDVPKPVSVKKRLTRVSKNMSEVWTKICWAIDDHAGDGSPLTTDTVQIWRTDKFVKQVLTISQQINVVKVLDQNNIPAWPLTDADIGPGGYGPQWRHWQDTQIIGYADLAAYKAQGYVVRGSLGPVGHPGADEIVVSREVDQLANVINMLKTNPDDRRMLVTAWNPGLVWRSALPPCHLYFQFMTTHRPGQAVYDDLVANNRWAAFNEETLIEGYGLTEQGFVEKFDKDLAFRAHVEKLMNQSWINIPVRDLHCLLVMRSSDTPLGTPFNVAQYSLLTHVIANVCNMKAASLTWVGGDAHIYVNQIDGIREQLSRESHPDSDPRISFKRKLDNIDDFTLDDVEFAGYEHQGFIDIPVAV